MEPKQTLQQVSDTTLQEPVSITVDVQPVNKLHKLFQHWGIASKTKVFELRPIFLGTLIRISKLLLSVEIKLPDGTTENKKSVNLLDANYQAISEHSETIARIVALALRNSDRPADQCLVRFILRNFTTREMMGVLSIVLKQMDLTSFMTSIISVRGLNVLNNQANAPAIPVNGNEVSL